MTRQTQQAVVTVSLIVLADILTKWWALAELAPGYTRYILGVPITLAFNTGAAFSLSVGAWSRWIFLAFTVVALVAIVRLFREAAADDRLRHIALALVLAGALGNMVDRIRWSRGVVDFIGPVNLGFTDFPIFNIADSSITVGIGLLLISFWREGKGQAASQEERAPALSEDTR